ncbi:hypothetical protein LWI28_023699 [Acer negundo]|uniref:Uncharacterized protein n=1 Tax=Acer negundo TaxID=4023 RepID=A0AAD5NK99_ACENE|nr:hypothetical protein LWI28_023699 [Acer negundo]
MSVKEPYYYDYLGVDEESTKLGSGSGASLSTNSNQSQNATNSFTALAGARSSSGPGEELVLPQNLFTKQLTQTDISRGNIILSTELFNKHIVPSLNESQKEILLMGESFRIFAVDYQSNQQYEMMLGQATGYSKCLKGAKKFIRNKNLQVRQVNKKITKSGSGSGSGAFGSSSASNTNETRNAAANYAVSPAGASSRPGEAPIKNYFTKKLTPSDLNRNSIFVLAKYSGEEHIVSNLNEIDKAELKDGFLSEFWLSIIRPINVIR